MYAIVDIETTGGYAENHRITEVAIYHHDGIQITDSFHTLINPGRNIPYYITGLTGITTEMVLDSPQFEEIADEFSNGWKVKFSWPIMRILIIPSLKKEFEQVGINWQSKKLCTVRLSRKIIPGLRSYSLGSLAESLGIEITNRHRAGGDAAATAKIFDQLLRRDRDGYILKVLKAQFGRNDPASQSSERRIRQASSASWSILFSQCATAMSFMLAKRSTSKNELPVILRAMHVNGADQRSGMKFIISPTS